MSELDPIEATRQEFEAVMRLPSFASIEQVASELGLQADAARRHHPTSTRSEPTIAGEPTSLDALPTRSALH